MNEFIKKLSKEELEQYITYLADVEKAQEELVASQTRMFELQTTMMQASNQHKEISEKVTKTCDAFNAYVEELGKKYEEKEEPVKEEKEENDENHKTKGAK